MKKLKSFLSLALLAATLPVAAQQYEVVTLTTTNNVPNNSTTTANLGSGITATKYEEIGVEISYELNGAGTTACTFNFVTSLTSTNFATSAQHIAVIAPNGTTTVSTNFNVTLGSKGYFKPLSIVAANNSAAMTNIVIKVSKKPVRNGS